MRLPRIIDNERHKLGDVLKGLSSKHDHLSIATGYWDLPGTKLLLEEIKNYKSIRLLLGQEPLITRHKRKLEIEAPPSDFPDKDIASDLIGLSQEDGYRELIRELKLLIREGRLEVKVYRRDFLHAKCYIFGHYKSQEAVGIIGSSNFTQAGLMSNAELNSLEDNYQIVKYRPQNETDENGHLSWFDKVWNDELTQVWDGQFKQILENSPVGDMAYSPYEMYIKTLWEIYEDEVLEDKKLPEQVADPLYSFQKRNAELLIKKLNKHGLAMLADSVGLGKTITAGAVLKYYKEEKKAKRIYVIAPASLCKQWEHDLAKRLDLYGGFTILSMQNLQKIAEARRFDELAGVDLFIIDEAHNLRSDTGLRHRAFRDWFSAKENKQSKILLLTATPINNRLEDLSNQIQLAAKGSLRSFPVTYSGEDRTEVLDFFDAVKRLQNDISRAVGRGESPNYNKINSVMRQGLRYFLVRTTRKGAQDYSQTVVAHDQSYGFPQGKVRNQPYDFSSLGNDIQQFLAGSAAVFNGVDPTSLELESLLEQTQYTQHPLELVSKIKTAAVQEDNVFINIFQTMQLLGFVLYRPMTYQNSFYGKSADDIKKMNLAPSTSFTLNSQMSIHNMLRVTFLKRLESSVYALRMSLEKYQQRLDIFAQNLERGFIIPVKDYQIVDEEFGDDLEAAFENIQSLESAENIDQNSYNMQALRQDIEKDRAIVEVLLKTCRLVEERDDKLQAFAQLLNQLIKDKPAGSKILIFSYYADTITYLEDKLPQLIKTKLFKDKAAFVSGQTSKTQVSKIVGRFAPEAKGVKADSEEELDYLFSTDILSEGQNLQDCGTLINFDLHWNPVRMIQRNGRINRLGSKHKEILIYNMYPETNLETYLRLVKRLQQKIDHIKHTIGTDQSVLGEAAKPIEYVDQIPLLYNSQKAEETYQSIIDDNEQLLGIDEYIADLRLFLDNSDQATQQRVKNIPLGKWGYMPKTNLNQPFAMVLACVEGKILETGSSFRNYLFIEVIPEKENIKTSVLETISALRYLRTKPDDNQPLIDKINYDRNIIKRRALGQARVRVETDDISFKLTPSYRRVLSHLKENEPEVRVAEKLQLITTIQDEKALKTLFRDASSQLKQQAYLGANIIDGFKEFERRLDQYERQNKELTNSKGVLFYARQ